MTPSEFTAWCAAKEVEYGSKWDPSDLEPRFIPFFRTDQRIRVACMFNTSQPEHVRTGTVGVTTGWRPAFLLMHRRIVAVQHGRTYREVAS